MAEGISGEFCQLSGFDRSARSQLIDKGGARIIRLLLQRGSFIDPQQAMLDQGTAQPARITWVSLLLDEDVAIAMRLVRESL